MGEGVELIELESALFLVVPLGKELSRVRNLEKDTRYEVNPYLSRIDRFSLGPNEEVLRGGVTVLEGAGILARGTGSCT